MAVKVKWIQLEPAEYPADDDWGAMTPEDRGCYHSLIVYLGCSGGTLPNDRSALRILCNANEEVFETFWKKYSRKFIVKDGNIKHKRVSREIRKARKYLLQKSLAGKASGKARRTAVERPLNGRTNGVPTNKTKTNIKEISISTNRKSQQKLALEQQKLALDFDDKLEKLFGPFMRGERVTFRHIREWLYAQGKLAAGIRVMKESKTWQEDYDKERIEGVKCFVSKIKKMGWKRR